MAGLIKKNVTHDKTPGKERGQMRNNENDDAYKIVRKKKATSANE